MHSRAKKLQFQVSKKRTSTLHLRIFFPFLYVLKFIYFKVKIKWSIQETHIHLRVCPHQESRPPSHQAVLERCSGCSSDDASGHFIC
jgi:hypothetical protein